MKYTLGVWLTQDRNLCEKLFEAGLTIEQIETIQNSFINWEFPFLPTARDYFDFMFFFSDHICDSIDDKLIIKMGEIIGGNTYVSHREFASDAGFNLCLKYEQRKELILKK